jgi:multidrug resistance efflux pump
LNRLFWILGLALLVGTVAGARWLLNPSAAGDGAAKSNPRASDLPAGDGIVCLGFVDVEDGLTTLHPVQAGRVTEVWVSENDWVPEGYLLFRLDPQQQRLQLRKARADLEAARQTHAKAELARGMRDRTIQLATEAIEVAERAHNSFEMQLHIKRDLLRDKQINEREVKADEEKLAALKAAVKVKKIEKQEAEAINPEIEIARAWQDVEAKQARVEEARLALLECDVYAPVAGRILRLHVNPGELVSTQSKQPAVQFCPDKPRIVRAEVLQEWAGRVEAGQSAVIEDDTRAGPQWKGKVQRVSEWFSHRRSIIQEPFQFNDVRTVECIISIDPSSRPLRIGQRVRVTIRQGGP